MIIMPYKKDQPFDDGLRFVLATAKKCIMNENSKDDFTLLNCGHRGTGKSTLSLHIEDSYLGDEASVDYIGLNPSDFAKAIKAASDKPLPRFCNNDEGNLSKRDTQNRYNKDVLDLYYSIRGKQIFHIWNNPSLDIIDKKFIEDIIKGVILITGKDNTRPRIYFYFRKMDILRIWEKYESLSIRLLKKVAGEYAYFRGWFKNYNGKLLKPYEEKKSKRMTEKVDLFFEKYGDIAEDGYTKQFEMVKQLGVTLMTFSKYLKKLQEAGIVKPEHIRITPTNRKYIKSELIEEFRKAMKEHNKVE